MADDVGYGQQTPWDTANESSLIEFMCKRLIARLSTMKLVKVVAVHLGEGDPARAGTVDVLPLVNMLDGGGNALEHGTVYGLPYLRIQNGGWAIINDPAVDDVGFVICADRDISAIKANADGKQANPGSYRQFDLADGVYIGGILNAAPEQYIELKADGAFKMVDGFGNVLETSGSGFAMTGDFHVQGAITASGEVTAKEGANHVGLSTHRHTSAAAGNPTSAPTPGS